MAVLCSLGCAAYGGSKEFGQANLEKIVVDLDKVIPENAHFKYPVKCSIVDKKDVNAYATVVAEGSDSRATMVVYTGLIKEIGGDERLIRAVVAHELSHLSRGHQLERDPTARDLSNLWTRQQEFEADKFGAEALVKSGHSKKDMVDMLLFLDRTQGRRGAWLGNLTADHADPKARAAEVSENPAALRALVQFDIALAYEDARNHLYAQKLFDSALTLWPDLNEAYINSGKCALLYYYDNLPSAVRTAWWRPDFGPLITNPHAPAAQAVEVTDQDREAWKDAYKAATLAVTNNPNNSDALELQALAEVLEPDAKKEVVGKGVEWFKDQMTSATDPILKLRYANNAGVGIQRISELSVAYHLIMDAQKGSDLFNAAIGENLGLVVVKGRAKGDDELAANVLFTWLSNTPPDSPRWNTVKKTFDDICTTAGIKAKEISQKPGYLCRVTTLVTSGKELGILLPVSMFEKVLGAPQKSLSFAEKWPDLLELQWNDDKLVAWTERDKVMRITSYEDGAYLLLKPRDAASQFSLKIKVGMGKDELFAMLNEKASEMKDLAKAGKIESWNYFPALNMGVLIVDGVVKGITVTPIAEG